MQGKAGSQRPVPHLRRAVRHSLCDKINLHHGILAMVNWYCITYEVLIKHLFRLPNLCLFLLPVFCFSYSLLLLCYVRVRVVITPTSNIRWP